jgi:predicted ATPase
VDWSDISLIPLSPDETITLTRNLLQGGVVPHDIQRQILEHAEGNPLFVEETLRSLIQKGILIEQNGQWRATHPLQQIEIPDTLRILLTSRVDHLPR